MRNRNVANVSSDEFGFNELIEKVKESILYLRRYWIKIGITSLIGLAVGYFYAWKQPTYYIARTTFVVEDPKSSSGFSGLASLAGQFGVDVNSGSGGGLIAGDNILFYFRSESLTREVLLSSWDKFGSESFADAYLSIHKVSSSIKENEQKIKLPVFKKSVIYSRIQDSVLNLMIESILKNKFSINRIDKKAGFLEAKVVSLSEEWSKRYCEKIVETAVRKYMALKTENQQNTVNKLQSRVDSIGRLLNLKTAKSANLQTSNATMDINPLYKTNTTVETELATRDKTMLATVYVEVVRNLELAKFTLNQETPVIQIIDKPISPLIQDKLSKKIFSLFGFIIGFAISSMIILIKRKNTN